MSLESKGEKSISQFIVFLAYAYLFIFYTRIQDNIPDLNSFLIVGL